MSYKPCGVTRGELDRRHTKSDRNPPGLPEWTFRLVDEVAELSVVTWPADQNACSNEPSSSRLGPARMMRQSATNDERGEGGTILEPTPSFACFRRVPSLGLNSRIRG